MNFNSFKYCLRQSFVSLRRNFWLAVVTSCIIAVSLAILGGFLLLAVNARQLMSDIGTNVEISVFLYDDAETAALEAEISALDGVDTVRFISKHDGLAEFARSLGDESFLVGLEGDNNPLPDAFRVRALHTEAVPALAAAIRALPGVELVEYGEEIISRLVKITGWLNSLFVGISGLLAIGAVFLIVTAIRLSVLARQEEIGIMKYLGASDWYIRFPFLLEGMVMGWLGTLAAVAALFAGYSRLVVYLKQDALIFFIRPVTAGEQLLPIYAGLVLLGTLLGGLGSSISIRKFLRV
ncbi:MAG TPA: ABC transporter permease [Firmicutes bacterium]|jgi:cell division transport system permease protein|nr:ABC transporter permease [Bacillota bacterium]